MGVIGRFGAPLYACRAINVAHTGVEKLSLQFDVSNVFVDISFVGEGFTTRILSFHFSFFESPLGSFQAQFCVPLRLSCATRGPLVLGSSSLGPYFGCLEPQSCLSLVGLCESLRNGRLHVRKANCAPFPGAQKHDRKRDMYISTRGRGFSH